MSHSHPNKHIPYCLNCHYPLAEMDNFCPNCGQKPTDGKTSMHDLIHEFVHTLFHLDGKFFTTLKHIFVPGKLTLEFFKGHHKRYAHPVQLFLVLGALLFGMIASSTSKFEKQTEEKLYKSRRKVEEKAFFRLIDSIGQRTAPTVENKTIGQAYDSLLMRTYQHWLKKNTADENEEEAESKKTSSKKNQKDTIYTFAGGALKITKDADNMDETDEKPLEKPQNDIKSQSQSDWNDFKKGFNESVKTSEKNKKEGKTDTQIIADALNLGSETQTLKDVLTHEDSTTVSQLSFASLRLPTAELYELGPEEILDKYNIHDFWERLSLKQAIKAQKDTKSLVHFAMGKLFWFTFLLIPIMSGFFMLLYRKKNYFVEHFIFFMHYNIFLFATSILIIFINTKFDFTGFNIWFFLGVMVFFYFAMKNYYQQSWRKTFVKYLIANMGYFIFSILLTVLGGILSFLLF
jgi:Protein of unknown function (DUF3667)